MVGENLSRELSSLSKPHPCHEGRHLTVGAVAQSRPSHGRERFHRALATRKTAVNYPATFAVIAGAAQSLEPLCGTHVSAGIFSFYAQDNAKCVQAANVLDQVCLTYAHISGAELNRNPNPPIPSRKLQI